MFKKIWEFLSGAVTIVVTAIIGIVMISWLLFFNISCYWNAFSEPIKWVASWFEESVEDIEKFNADNPDLYKYKFGEKVVTLVSPDGYERITGDTYRIREFKGDHAREGLDDITHYLRTQDLPRFLEDMDFNPDYVMIVRKSDTDLFDKKISNEFLEDFYQQFSKIPEDDMKSIMLQAFDSMLLEELGITRDNLSDVKVDIRREMINEAMFYMTGIIKVYKSNQLAYTYTTTQAFLNVHGGLVMLFCTTPVDDDGATAESLINSWSEKIYNLNK